MVCHSGVQSNTHAVTREVLATALWQLKTGRVGVSLKLFAHPSNRSNHRFKNSVAGQHSHKFTSLLLVGANRALQVPERGRFSLQIPMSEAIAPAHQHGGLP